jgi:predicted transcriptional regulator
MVNDDLITPFSIAMDALSTLGNQNRWKIIESIRHENKATFTELKNITQMKGTALQFHIKKLIDARILIRTTERGPYKLSIIGIEAVRTFEVMQKAINKGIVNVE